MPNILNPIDTHYFFDNLEYFAENPHTTYKQKMYRFHQLYLSLINSLTEKRENQIFTGWFAKINFICQAYGLSTEWEEKLQALRRLLKKNAFSYRFEPEQGQYFASIQILAELTAYFSDKNVPEKLHNLYKDQEIATLIYKEKATDTVPLLVATLLDKSELKTDETHKSSIELDCETEEFGHIKISVQDVFFYSKGRIFKRYNLAKNCIWLQKYQLLHLTNLELIEENHYANTDKTLIISNPDYLIDASAIAKCFLNNAFSPYLSLLQRFEFFRGNEYTFGGNLINNMLDQIVINPDTDFQTALQNALSENSIEASGIEPDVLRVISEQLKPQFYTLKRQVQNYGDNLLTTEPSFISNIYGLQGRIDLLVEFGKNQATRKDIIELKSSKRFPAPKQKPAWSNDMTQVACYNLLIDSTFEQRNGISAILYSKDEQSPLRDCGKLNFEKQQAMLVRNQLVAIDFAMAQNSIKIFNNLFRNLVNANVPDFVLRNADVFHKRWESANELEKAYFVHFVGLIARELIVAKVGGVSGTEPHAGFSSLWNTTLEQKKESFVLLNGLKLYEMDSQKLEITFRRPESGEQTTSFREGDVIVLYPSQKSDILEPTHYQLLKGNILSISPELVKVTVWNKFVPSSYFKDFPFWTIEPNLMEKNFSNLFASMSEFLGADTAKKDLLLGLRKPLFDESFEEDFTHIVSPEQNDILNQALSAKDYFLLQGPPGTGKTSKMLRTMVDYLYHNTKETIVLLAFTNRATDEISQKITTVCEGNFIRFGNLDEKHPFRENTLNIYKDFAKIRQKLQETRIFVSTVSSFYNHFHLVPNLDTIIVDEASQLLEPHLCGILPLFKRFILVGDEKQLPAVVTQAPHFCDIQEENLQKINIKNLSVSIFERLLHNAEANHWHDTYKMLGTQFRTHQDIAGFINQEFYKKLQVGSERQKEPLRIYNPNSANELEQFLAKSRILFIPTEKEINFKYHTGEAQKVVELLDTIRAVFGENFNEETVGVITPFRAQIAEIYKQLDTELRQKVTVDTVERYQGSEREIIIISMATNHLAQMKNLQAFNLAQTVDKKLNVALSRAKEQVILLGNPEVLKQGKFYRKLLEYIK